MASRINIAFDFDYLCRSAFNGAERTISPTSAASHVTIPAIIPDIRIDFTGSKPFWFRCLFFYPILFPNLLCQI